MLLCSATLGTVLFCQTTQWDIWKVNRSETDSGPTRLDQVTAVLEYTAGAEETDTCPYVDVQAAEAEGVCLSTGLLPLLLQNRKHRRRAACDASLIK